MRRPSQVLAEHHDEVLRVIAECGAVSPRVFGSVARGDDDAGSDVDILVTVPPEHAWRFVELRQRLTEILGTGVDVVSENGLTAKHRRILAEAVPM